MRVLSPDLYTGIPAKAEHQPPFPQIQEPRQPVVRVGTYQMLVVRVHHGSLKPTRLTHKQLQDISIDAAALYASASGFLMNLVPEVVPEVVGLPGNASRYQNNQDAVAAAVQEALGDSYDLSRYDVIAYFLPGDTNRKPFSIGTTGRRPKGRRLHADVFMNKGIYNRGPSLAHEIGHALMWYNHACSASVESLNVTHWDGDPYEMMGYGLKRTTVAPGHIGFSYRYFSGWLSEDQYTLAREPGQYVLTQGNAIRVATEEGSPVWLELISDKMAYGEEAGGLLVRLDNQPGMVGKLVDMTPATTHLNDAHLKVGGVMNIEDRTIRFVSRKWTKDGYRAVISLN